jgi:hypothetical protein
MIDMLHFHACSKNHETNFESVAVQVPHKKRNILFSNKILKFWWQEFIELLQLDIFQHAKNIFGP